MKLVLILHKRKIEMFRFVLDIFVNFHLHYYSGIFIGISNPSKNSVQKISEKLYKQVYFVQPNELQDAVIKFKCTLP